MTAGIQVNIDPAIIQYGGSVVFAVFLLLANVCTLQCLDTGVCVFIASYLVGKEGYSMAVSGYMTVICLLLLQKI